MSDSAETYNFFGFYPSLGAGVTFVVAFSLMSLLHLALTIKSRYKWGVVTVIGGIVEIIGWIGRLGGHYAPLGLSYYLMQQVCLAFAPVFYSATLYIMFGKATIVFGTELSRLKPYRYTLIFVIVDIISLVLQGVGGGMSGSAASSGNPTTLTNGRNIYLAGISFQLANMIVFCYLVVEYFFRMKRAGRITKAQMTAGPTSRLLISIAVASALIIMRNIFREFELAEGFDGHLATTEPYFDCLDANPMVLCMIFLALGHPLYTFCIIERQRQEATLDNTFSNSTLVDGKVSSKAMNEAKV